ncbi:MAG: arsenate reductase ArsC [Candidatus Scalindua sp. AMX11]|nr:MAG: arsenate reductase ArsC [Candidatus Scalindua sp.]NOG82822.1 arsenate reductase ArsC [Planctomycetota bacterium]RZV86171.1 MAG: arsenate reductase ArsC [Candidatus Scalindua sp. SCAELEC01]TDE65885.1 MAG: arsenate reductase ArsC [Candidatus Scalindua sp. AMX11]GJQ58293.1 MAG: arsenate reductase [Candidatus Scalindua sp.]
MLNILILCTGNSCRSILGEALLNSLGRGRVKAFSAGSHPTGEVNVNALATLRRHNVSTVDLYSKSWDIFMDQKIDSIITVCDHAAAETCPVFLHTTLRAHWGVPDPAHEVGTDEEIRAVFEKTFGALERRIIKMLELPLGKLSGHELIAELNKIGEMDNREGDRHG